MRRVAYLRQVHIDPPELSAEDRIMRLQDELRLLKPYTSTAGLRLLKARVAEIERAIDRLRELPFDG